MFIDYLPNHISKNYDRDLKKLFGILLDMAKTTADKLVTASELLSKPDPEKAKSIIDGDCKINDIEKDINQCVINILALRRPLAEDLRWTIFALKTASNIEQIADHIKKMAQYSHAVISHPQHVFLTKKLTQMANFALEMLREVMLTEGVSVDNLSKIIETDKSIDNLYGEVLKNLFNNFKQNNNPDLTSNINIIFLAKNIELIGDTISQIAEYMYSVFTGIDLENIQ